jgi:hypothetical protein
MKEFVRYSNFRVVGLCSFHRGSILNRRDKSLKRLATTFFLDKLDLAVKMLGTERQIIPRVKHSSVFNSVS